MKKSLLFFVFLIFLVSINSASAQKSRIIMLGDLHYNLMDDHDKDWLRDNPEFLNELSTYAKVTSDNWLDFMSVLRTEISEDKKRQSVVVQVGDLSEGLAGSELKAKQMARNTMQAVEDAHLNVPWILTKGNHEITGPGAENAFVEFYIPMIQKQTSNKEITKANYSYKFNGVHITCIDPWDKSTDIIDFLNKELSGSDAKVKFVMVHQPIIPVSGWCWHIFNSEADKREQLLNVIAKNKAVVLCGHIHKYSVVRRDTEFGPVVQIMGISVVGNRDYVRPDFVITEYGSSLMETTPVWNQETIPERKDFLDSEKKYVKFFKQCDLPGYAILDINADKKQISLSYYPAFKKKAYDKINISRLMNKKF